MFFMCNHRGIERTLNAATGLHSALVHQARPAKAPLFVAGTKAGVGVEAGHPRGVDFRLPQRPLHWTSLVSSKRHKSGRQPKCYSWKGSSAGVGLAQNLFFSKKQTLETVQDFLIKLGIKTLMHLLEISIFSLNNGIVRITKIMNNLVKDLKILRFKVIFQCLKLVKSFQKKCLWRIFD